MTGKELLQNNPLELMVHSESVPVFNEPMQQLNRDYVLECEQSEVQLRENFTVFTIYCPTTGFASAYYALGLAIGQIRAHSTEGIGLFLINNNKIKHDAKGI